MPNMAYSGVDVFQAIAQPKRRQLLDALADGPRAVGELVEILGEAQPAVSKHLRVLRDVGLASSKADGPTRLYSLHPDGLRELDAWLDPYRRRWEATLARLEEFLDAKEQ